MNHNYKKTFSSLYFIIIIATITTISMISALTILQTSNAQPHIIHSDIDVTPIAGIITITKDKDGNTIFNPQLTTIKQNQEILILNNDTEVAHSFTNGENPQDPMAGKLFDSGMIQPKGFIEYVATNLSPGNYTFFTKTDPTITGQLSILQK